MRFRNNVNMSTYIGKVYICTYISKVCIYTYMENLKNYLKTLNSPFKNPFLNPYFEVVSAESFGMEADIHKVETIKLIFFDNFLSIKFRGIDQILAIYLFCFISYNEYGFDPYLQVFVNKKKLNWSHSSRTSDFINIFDMLKTVSKSEICTITLKFSLTKYGENAFTFHKQNVIFIIDEFKDDLERYEEEIEARASRYETDDEI